MKPLTMPDEPGHIFYCEWCRKPIDTTYAEHYYGHGKNADICKAYDRHLRRAVREKLRENQP